MSLVLISRQGNIAPTCLSRFDCCHIAINRGQVYQFTLRSEVLSIELLDQSWIIGQRLLYIPSNNRNHQWAIVQVKSVTVSSVNRRDLCCTLLEDQKKNPQFSQVTLHSGLFLLQEERASIKIPICRDRSFAF